MTSGKMIMASLADSIELFHRDGWNKIEKEIPASLLPNFRKKVDLLLYRIYSRLTCAVQLEVFHFVLSFFGFFQCRWY
jgi:hypothetical protein